MRNYLKVILLLISLSVLLLAAEDELLKTRMNTASESFKDGDYNSAYGLFKSLRSSARMTEYYPMVIYMQALSAYYAGRYSKAEEAFGEFIYSFPDHPFYYRALLFDANSKFFLKNYNDAAIEYLRAMNSSDDALRTTAYTSAENLLWGYLSIDEIRSLYQRAPLKSAGLVGFYLVKRLEQAGRYAEAISIANKLTQDFPSDEVIPKLRKIMQQLSDRLSQHIVVSVILPTTGTYTDYGKSVLNGIKLAFNEFEKKNGKDIELKVSDSRGEPLRCVQQAEKVFRSDRPLAVIGPLLSEEAVALGTLGKAYSIPVVSPTAAEDGLATISPYFFQISTSPMKSARGLAQFACDSLGDTTFAILAPDDPLGRGMSDIFSGVVEAKGRTLTAVEFYPPGAVDLSEQLKNIKTPLLDKLDAISTHADTTDPRFYDPDGTLRPREEWIVPIDGFFLPAYYDEIVNILPQIPFNYIKTQILGANEWVVGDLINEKDLEPYIDKAIFVPDQFYVDNDNADFRSFSRAYRSSYGDTPDRLAALGYDAASLICNGLKKKAITPELMKDFLSGTINYHGVSGLINFDETGANTYTRVVRYEKNGITEIK